MFGKGAYKAHAKECGTHGGPKHAKTLMCASNYSTEYVCPFYLSGDEAKMQCPYEGHIPKGAEITEMEAESQVLPEAPGIVEI